MKGRRNASIPVIRKFPVACDGVIAFVPARDLASRQRRPQTQERRQGCAERQRKERRSLLDGAAFLSLRCYVFIANASNRFRLPLYEQNQGPATRVCCRRWLLVASFKAAIPVTLTNYLRTSLATRSISPGIG